MKDQIIYDVCRVNKCSDALSRLIIAQAMHETANFTSGLARDDNNYFGMKVPKYRKTNYIFGPSVKHNPPSNEGRGKYASYLTIANSVCDLLNWLSYKGFNFDIKTADEYCKFLINHAYTNNLALYTSAIKSNLERIKNKNYEREYNKIA